MPSTQQQRYLINQLSEMPVFLEKAFLGFSLERLTRKPENDRSPLLEHLWHLRDCESDLYGLRIDRVFKEIRPYLAPVNVSGWPIERGYHLRDGEQAIREFSALRLALIERLGEADLTSFERVGVRQDQSEVNIFDLAEHLADHDRDHRWRMSAILREYMDQ
jgi:DinB superfamily